MPGPAAGLAMIGLGSLMSGIAGIKSNLDQASAERANAAFFMEQARFAEIAGERAEFLLRAEANRVRGQQISTFAKAGVDLSGSALSVLADTANREERESLAIRRETELNVKMAMLRAQSSQELADSLSSFTNNALQFGASILSGGARAYQAGAL